MCVRVYVCACVRATVRACVRACVFVSTSVFFEYDVAYEVVDGVCVRRCVVDE